MTRTALVPVQSHNPDVQPQAPGYAIYDPARDVFACEPRDGVPELGECMTHAAHVGWCGARGKVRVWASLASASTVAVAMRCEVVTVPRYNGHVFTWGHVAGMVLMVWDTDWSKV
jgi:hypothetical protein